MLTSCFRPMCIIDQIIGVQAKLRCQEFCYRLRDRFSRCQQSPRKPKCTQLKRKSKLITGAASRANDFQIVVRQNVMLKKLYLVTRQVEKCRTLALG